MGTWNMWLIPKLNHLRSNQPSSSSEKQYTPIHLVHNINNRMKLKQGEANESFNESRNSNIGSTHMFQNILLYKININKWAISGPLTSSSSWTHFLKTRNRSHFKYIHIVTEQTTNSNRSISTNNEYSVQIRARWF